MSDKNSEIDIEEVSLDVDVDFDTLKNELKSFIKFELMEEFKKEIKNEQERAPEREQEQVQALIEFEELHDLDLDLDFDHVITKKINDHEITLPLNLFFALCFLIIFLSIQLMKMYIRGLKWNVC